MSCLAHHLHGMRNNGCVPIVNNFFVRQVRILQHIRVICVKIGFLVVSMDLCLPFLCSIRYTTFSVVSWLSSRDEKGKK